MELSKDWPSNPSEGLIEELTHYQPPENISDKFFRINFVCPSCGHTELCQVDQVHLKTPVIETWAEEDEFAFDLADGDKIDYSTSEFLKYECDYCGFEPPVDSSDLFRWLMIRGMLEEI